MPGEQAPLGPNGLPLIGDRAVVAARGRKNAVDPRVPYAFLVERERSAAGNVVDVATLFLTNRECPFGCVYCDLWKNTTDARVAVGAIPAQIDHALARLPAATQIKLYNSGNFFDAQAIPSEDLPDIAARVARFDTVIVENHPRLCGAACVDFRDRLVRERAKLFAAGTVRHAQIELEIAMGLETIHPEILPALNKRMTLDDFRNSARFLRAHEIEVRAFVLLAPPWMPPEECVDWALRSFDLAFACGARVCTVIPVRGGNGLMDELARAGAFTPPRLADLEDVIDRALGRPSGRVFADTWDLARLFDCPACGPARQARLEAMNLTQQIQPRIACHACGAS